MFWNWFCGGAMGKALECGRPVAVTSNNDAAGSHPGPLASPTPLRCESSTCHKKLAQLSVASCSCVVIFMITTTKFTHS